MPFGLPGPDREVMSGLGGATRAGGGREGPGKYRTSPAISNTIAPADTISPRGTALAIARIREGFQTRMRGAAKLETAIGAARG